MKTYNVKTVKCGTETVRHRAPQIWDLVPKDIKESINLVQFKTKIKLWIPDGCKCNLCKDYIQGVGYI